jgi:aminomethyltransferase
MASALERTPLYDAHRRLEGKMVPFAGYEMPVQYPTGITAEHHAVREAAGLFDVSHMGEFRVSGDDALELIQRIAVNDASSLQVGQAQYSAMCDERGGVIDDLLVYRHADHYMLVVNASRRQEDWAWIHQAAEGMRVELADQSDEIGLIALQGPRAEEILAPLTDVDLDQLGYYRFMSGRAAGATATVSRTGYTGEDGFELYVPASTAETVWEALLEAGGDRGLIPAGLGARDSLRLEMGYALYGNDLDLEHTPIEAGLGWIVKLDKPQFTAKKLLQQQKNEGASVRLVGFTLRDRGFPRPGYEIVAEGEPVGTVTSGTMSPSLGYGIGMGYVPNRWSKTGTELAVRIRGKDVAILIQRPPFYTEGSIRR